MSHVKLHIWRVLATFSLILAVILTAVSVSTRPAYAGGGYDALCQMDPNFTVYIYFISPNEAFYISALDVATSGQTVGIRTLQGSVSDGPATIDYQGGYPSGSTTITNVISPDLTEFGNQWDAAVAGGYAIYADGFFNPGQSNHILWVSYKIGDQSGDWTYNGCDLVDVWPNPSPTPTSTPSASPSVSPTATPSVSPTPTDSPTPTPSVSPSPSVDPTPSPSPVASGVVISPVSITMGLSCPVVPMTATLVDTNGNPITSGITSIDWGMSSTNSIGMIGINVVNNLQAEFQALNLGTGNIYVTIWYNGQSYVGSIPVEVNNLTNCPLPIPTPSPSVSPAPSDNGSNNNSNSDSTNHNSAGEAPKCTDQKPGSAPVLNDASVTGDNEVTLYWSKANDPVTYYLITYGNKPGEQAYGNPNVGNKNTTQYTVKNLSGGQTYYFKVRSGNGCQPGEFSNELAATPGGGQVSGPASGFAAGVLGETTEEEASPTPTPSQEATNSASMTPSITPEVKVKGATGTCQDPWWKVLLLIADLFVVGLALVVSRNDSKQWWMWILPMTVVAAAIVWLFFCSKISWILVYLGIAVMAYLLKKMSQEPN